MDDAPIIRPGEIAPDFVLPDSTGITRRLSDLAAGYKLILIFYRGYW
jgi:peroxiredoxin